MKMTIYQESDGHISLSYRFGTELRYLGFLVGNNTFPRGKHKAVCALLAQIHDHKYNRNRVLGLQFLLVVTVTKYIPGLKME